MASLDNDITIQRAHYNSVTHDHQREGDGDGRTCACNH